MISFHSSRRQIYSGFSLLEFGMVTLILGVALVITLPVVLKSQTEARQMSCAMKMGNLARAVLAFENSNGRMPVAGIVGPAPSQSKVRGSFNERSGQQISWIVLTLAFQNQQDAFDLFDLNQTAFEQSDEAIGNVINGLLCPADNIGAFFFHHTQSGLRFANGNYVAFISPVHGEHEEFLPGALGGFEPGTTDGQRAVQISDGAANTLMLTEVRRRPPRDQPGTIYDQRGAWALPWMGSSNISADVHNENVDSGTFGLFDPYVPDPNQGAFIPPTPNSDSTQHIPDQIQPCARPLEAINQGMLCSRYAGYGFGFTAAAPRSLHGGGVNMAFVDGRVKFVTDDVDFVLYANLISTNNGRPRFTPPKLTRPTRANRD